MATRWEKEENGGNALVIDGWENGIAPDPYSGIGNMKQVDLETPGEVAVGYPITASTVSGATLGVPVARSTRFFPTYSTPVGVPDGAAKSYAMLDAGGQVFEATTVSGTWNFLSSSNSTTGSTANDGLAYWLGYLFKTRGANIDYWDGSTWTTGWQTTLDAGVKHEMYVASNNQLYITNGNTLARVFAPNPAAFAPGTGSTFDFDPEILSLPVTDVALSLAEVGSGNSSASTLLIGGAQNQIYPWDKVSENFALPIYVADPYISKMVSANQNAFIFPGTSGSSRGRIYITNGSQADLYFKIPDYIYGEQDPYYWWGDAIYHRNNLVFGFFIQQNGNSGSVVSGNNTEIWALNLENKAFRSISTIPTGPVAFAEATTLIPAINPGAAGFSYIVGYRYQTTAGIGYSGTTAGVGTGTVYSDLMDVGTFLQKKTFTQVEFKLRTPLASGENIVITPIADTVTGSVLAFSPTPTTGSLSGVAPVNFQANQWLQFLIALTGNSATSGCRLKEIRLR